MQKKARPETAGVVLTLKSLGFRVGMDNRMETLIMGFDRDCYIHGLWVGGLSKSCVLTWKFILEEISECHVGQ